MEAERDRERENKRHYSFIKSCWLSFIYGIKKKTCACVFFIIIFLSKIEKNKHKSVFLPLIIINQG